MREKKRGSFGGLRRNIGIHNPLSKLTDEQVNQIRMMYKETNLTQRDIAAKFGITDGYVCMLLKKDRRMLPTPDVNEETTKNRRLKNTGT
jgi:DNA-binding transcriptional regulator LsrR (DeoR family)